MLKTPGINLSTAPIKATKETENKLTTIQNQEREILRIKNEVKNPSIAFEQIIDSSILNEKESPFGNKPHSQPKIIALCTLYQREKYTVPTPAKFIEFIKTIGNLTPEQIESYKTDTVTGYIKEFKEDKTSISWFHGQKNINFEEFKEGKFVYQKFNERPFKLNEAYNIKMSNNEFNDFLEKLKTELPLFEPIKLNLDKIEFTEQRLERLFSALKSYSKYYSNIKAINLPQSCLEKYSTQIRNSDTYIETFFNNKTDAISFKQPPFRIDSKDTI